MIQIHISDWNMNDRVIHVSPADAQRILLDRTKPASERMRELYDAATKRIADPRASQMDGSDLFLSWPGSGIGFVPDEKWDNEHAEDLEVVENWGQTS